MLPDRRDVLLDFEKLGLFYLGKEYDVAAGKLLQRLLLYDARDLTTHAVCVGMTGSGKTGLCIDLLEEAAIDHVPAIIIDPKGDITNLLLNFPELRPGDFRPWINVDDARRKDLSEEAFAAEQAGLWREGLERWGQGSTRLLLLRASADFSIYTPGSEAGIPVSILRSFDAPDLDWESEAELLREHIQGTVSALLDLIGVDTDPVRSREHILLCNLLEYFWRRQEPLDLPRLIQAIQKPPLQQLGVMDVDTFLPEAERSKLAMAINNLIAAPTFKSWLHGQSLDVPSFLATPEGRPRHSIFYIAHLSDHERMFFVSMLLNQVLVWMRSQPGTTSLRALLYMDEVFGFLPPVANPPSKRPLLTLLKQARAFGLGVVLTTQNPVDLDYKGLANTGTWFIGRLQTERDKARLLDGLESASSAAGQSLNREALSRTISNLQKRVFLLHSIYEDAPVAFKTRWAMSYLRGPLTRPQIQELMRGRSPDRPARSRTPLAPEKTASLEPLESVEPATVADEAVPAAVSQSARPAALPESRSKPAAPVRLLLAAPPTLSSRVEQVYLPIRRELERARQLVQAKAEGAIEFQEQRLLYVPAVLGLGQVDYVDPRKGVYEQERFALLGRAGGIGRAVWEQARPIELALEELSDRPVAGASFVDLPVTLDESGEFTALKKALADMLYYNRRLVLLYSPELDLYSTPQESERDLALRAQQAARERRDQELDDLYDRYEAKLARIEERLRKAEANLERKQADARARGREAVISIGESVFGIFRGRRTTRGLSTYMSKRRQADLKDMEVEDVEASIDLLEQEMRDLQAELEREVEAVRGHWDAALEQLQEVPIRPRRQDVQIELFALAWAPHWWLVFDQGAAGMGKQLVPAF
ncbi:MAG: hypothetical protein JXA37_01960 [Chloroflexia bacterium]|nr:hypothetical protein [Chloroflexia bacterium]